MLVAPGAYPNDDEAPAGDFQEVASEACDGTTERTAELDGLLGSVNVDALKERFPPGTAGTFDGRETGSPAEQTSNGRPNTAPYGFVVKVVASSTVEGVERTGEDRRQAFLHRDADLLPGFPKELLTDGASSPLFVDLDGDNRQRAGVRHVRRLRARAEARRLRAWRAGRCARIACRCTTRAGRSRRAG